MSQAVRRQITQWCKLKAIVKSSVLVLVLTGVDPPCCLLLTLVLILVRVVFSVVVFVRVILPHVYLESYLTKGAT